MTGIVFAANLVRPYMSGKITFGHIDILYSFCNHCIFPGVYYVFRADRTIVIGLTVTSNFSKDSRFYGIVDIHKCKKFWIVEYFRNIADTVSQLHEIKQFDVLNVSK
jgi:hypothetical protein